MVYWNLSLLTAYICYRHRRNIRANRFQKTTNFDGLNIFVGRWATCRCLAVASVCMVTLERSRRCMCASRSVSSSRRVATVRQSYGTSTGKDNLDIWKQGVLFHPHRFLGVVQVIVNLWGTTNVCNVFTLFFFADYVTCIQLKITRTRSKKSVSATRLATLQLSVTLVRYLFLLFIDWF